ncbi:MAG: hypothetical protein AAGB00_13290 [Planctomycetota bacterium]
MPRFVRPLATALLVVFIAGGPVAGAKADAPDTYKLRYKFQAGDVLRYEVDHRADIRSTIEKTSQRAQTRSESVKAWKVIDVLPSGDIEFQNVVERVKMTNRLPDRAEMVFDSSKDKTPPPGFGDAAEAVGKPLSQVRMKPWGKVVAREVKHQQPAADPNAPITALLPEEPIVIGDTWDEPQEITVNTDAGGTKAIKTRRHFTLKSVKSGVAVIDVSQQVLSPVTPAIEAQLAQRMMKGTIRFDVDRGRILSQQMDVDRRIVGFAGPASRMHYQMRMQEKLVEKTAFNEQSVLVKQKTKKK